MREMTLLSLLVALSVTLTTCGSENAVPGPQAGPEANAVSPAEPAPGAQPPATEHPRRAVGDEELATVVQGNSQFALMLYARLAAGEGNLFFSPNSISTALAMTYAGARGRTRTQMQEILRLPLEGEALHACFAALSQQLHNGARQGGGYQLSIANRLWGERSFVFREAFLRLTRTYYGAELAEVDFITNAEGVRKTINDWVAEETRQKIQDLLAPGTITPITRLVLTNAIYFKGDWATQFSKEATRQEPFWVSAADKVDVPMMHQLGTFGYREDGQLQALELPYAGDALSMLVLLPKERDGLLPLEQSLTMEKLEQWSGLRSKRKVSVYLPKFRIEAAFALKDTLMAMGMTEAFSEEADFSGMVEDTAAKESDESLILSAVMHKAYVDVNEEGTEAAAATAVVVDRLTTSVPEPPVVFRADHPFLFFIRDVRTGSFLFFGRVMNPA